MGLHFLTELVRLTPLEAIHTDRSVKAQAYDRGPPLLNAAMRTNPKAWNSGLRPEQFLGRQLEGTVTPCDGHEAVTGKVALPFTGLGLEASLLSPIFPCTSEFAMRPLRRPQQGQASTPQRSRAGPSVRGPDQASPRFRTADALAGSSQTSAPPPYGLPTTSSGAPISPVPFLPLPAPPTGLSNIRLPPQITPIDHSHVLHNPNQPMGIPQPYSQLPPPAQPVPHGSTSSPPPPRKPPILPRTQSDLSPSAAAPMHPVDGGTSYFPDAHHFEISSLNISHSHQYTTPPKDVHELLGPYICYGAAHNSDERTNAPACHANTRVAVQRQVIGWMRHDDGEPQKIMWLGGPAGAGKTAIAGSVAEMCQKEGLLAASFFFSAISGSTDRYSKRRVITTIASHLAEHPALSDYKEQLLLSIERQPSIFRKRLKEQAECLILEPFGSIPNESDKAFWPKGIILDGLDEVVSESRRCDPHRPDEMACDDDQLEILEVLLILTQSPSFPFRIFVASRPEHNIANFFARPDVQTSTVTLFLDSKYNPDADIKLFLAAKFAEIRRCAWIRDVWPGEAILDRLVEMSSGQFIVPTTIIRWVESGLPREQLKVVLQLQEGAVGSKNPFANIDALYSHILRRSHNPEKDSVLVVKWIIAIASGSEHRLPAMFWRQFLEDEEGEFNYRMSPIASLISVPPPDEKNSLVTFYHKSLTDFLSTEARCVDLFVDTPASNTFVAHKILAVLQNNGPRIHSLSGADFHGFMTSFLELKLVLDHEGRNANFLAYLAACHDSGDILASCDVGWWARAIFHRLRTRRSMLYLATMLCTIHAAMLCPSNARYTANKARRTRCCGACVHWRTGILNSAKEHGLCVHALEKVGVDKLAEDPNLTDWISKEWRFWAVSFEPCRICAPESKWSLSPWVERNLELGL